jgi:hypothetical protein
MGYNLILLITLLFILNERVEAQLEINPIVGEDLLAPDIERTPYKPRRGSQVHEEETEQGGKKNIWKGGISSDIALLTLVVLVLYFFDPLRIFVATVRPIASTAVPVNVIARRKGKSQDYLLFNLVSFGDASALTAMKNAEITHVQLIEELLAGVKIIFVVRQTVVTGYNVFKDCPAHLPCCYDSNINIK